MEISGEKYLTSKEAAERSDYTTDHIARLCRQNILKNCRIGKKWYVEEHFFLEFIQNQEKQKSFKNIELSEKRVREFKVEKLKLQQVVQNVEDELILEARDVADYFLSHIVAFSMASIIYLKEQRMPILKMFMGGGYRYHIKFELPALVMGTLLMGSITTYLVYIIGIYATVAQASH